MFVGFWTIAIDGQTAQKNFNRVRTYDVQHYLIKTGFDRKNRTIAGETVISLKPLNRDFARVELDAADMKFESVTFDGESKQLVYKIAGEKLTIELGRRFAPKDLIKIRLKYTAKPRKGVYFVPAEVDRGGRVTRAAQVWTQGEPEEAHHWFPSYDFPDDKATTEQFVTAEAGETVIASGELVETTPNADGTQTFHFLMNIPHSTYLTSFVVGKYIKQSDSYRNIPLGYYVYPGREDLFKPAFGNTKEMMRIYEELTGVEFPYMKYDQTIVARFQFGGMENITATTYADTELFFYDYNPKIVEDVVSHELSHSWFGDLVTCRNWAELWLNEGFATFMEAAYREKMYGREEYLGKLRDDLFEYFAFEATAKPKRGLYNRFARPDQSIFDAVTYQKGGLVLHTLRETVGNEAFWKAVRIYLNRHRLGNVETADLQRAFEEASGKNLKWFFDQWVYGTGYPQLDVAYRHDPNSRKILITVTQTQKPADSSVAVFRFPLEVEIKTDAGSKIEKLDITKRTETFAVPADLPPTGIEVDPALRVPVKFVKVLDSSTH
ncbi:MAG: M1 family metallopeptidase [Acidobacteria bacterium]|nr:M1 family metallopeptidase [Acidobacteriota bacterium]